MFRVGLYARVSTHDQQTLPLQMRAMREYAARRGWAITFPIKPRKFSGLLNVSFRQACVTATNPGC